MMESLISKEKFIKIYINNCQVFVSESDLSEGQIQQLVTECEVDVNRLNAGLDVNDTKTTVTKRLKHPIDDWRHVLNETNLTINCAKRKSRSKTTRKPIGDKRKKNDLNVCNENNLNVMTNSDENKNKENQNQNNISSNMSHIIGLPNLGNTCYVNSIIQVLRITPGFKSFICFLNKSMDEKKAIKLDPKKKQLISSLHNIFVHFVDNEQNVHKLTDNLTNESKIASLIDCDIFKERFEFGCQQDCHEFLSWLINELNAYTQLLFPSKVNREFNSLNILTETAQKRSVLFSKRTISFQNFQGVMLRKIMCNECNRSSFTDDNFADIQIPLFVDEEVADIQSIQSFTDIIHRKDYLKDENMFECRNCSKKTNASVVNSIKIPPKVLIIFIKKPFGESNAKPLKNIFKFPLNLEYSSAEHSIQYSLYGLVLHSGDVDNGHYYALINSSGVSAIKGISTRNTVCKCDENVLADNSWIRVNDNKVNRISDTLLNKFLCGESLSSPYLAFYERKY